MYPESIYLRCKDHAEMLVFTQNKWKCGETDYDISIMDAYTGGDYKGIKGRFKRAFKAFFNKPIYYTGIYCENKDRVQKFLSDCLSLIENESEVF